LRTSLLDGSAFNLLQDLLHLRKRVEDHERLVARPDAPIDLHRWRSRHWTPALRAAGLPHRGRYAMRHTDASWAIAAGLPTFEIAAAMGTSLEQIEQDLRAPAPRLGRAGEGGAERLHQPDRRGGRRNSVMTTTARGATTILPVTTAWPDAQTVLAELERTNRLLVQQVFKPIANEYRISVPTPGSTEEGRPLLYVKQKKMTIREDIRFRVSPDDEQHMFMIKSKSVFEFRGRHEVLDAGGAAIGMLEKDFGQSLLRSHWHVRDAAGQELLEAHEASWIVALLRRFAQLGPDWFDLLTWLPFNFVLRRAQREVGTYKRVLGTFRDRYVIELGPELADVDRRLIVAFAIGLDALQDR
jgi:uncharacterized protein YxjI